MMPLWDHLFGGWSERRDANVAVGVDTPYRQGFWLMPDLLRDYWDFWKGLVGPPHLVAQRANQTLKLSAPRRACPT